MIPGDKANKIIADPFNPNSEVETMVRKARGREARKSLRSAPLTGNLNPVRPGLPGGQYKPLMDKDIPPIIDNIYRIAEEVGFAQATTHCTETCTAFGAIMGDDGRLRFPREVIDKALSLANHEVKLFGQDPKHDLDLSGKNVHFSTAGAAVMIADPLNNEYRESGSQDLYDMARIVDTCEHIHMFQRTSVIRDITNTYEMDLNTLYNAISGTSKHVGTSWVRHTYLEKCLPMLHLIAGGEAAWRARPFVSMSSCFVVPPMKFAEEALDTLRVAVESGMPVLLLSAGQAGATAPACLAGSVSQAWAECLAGLVYVNAIEAGASAIIGTWPFVTDLRTGAMSSGSPEQSLLSAACSQIADQFDLPIGVPGGMSDSKFPDFQGGAERAYTLLPTALSGANIVYESCGMYASLLGVCPESFIIDNDVLGACLRVTRGIEVNQETLSFETIKEVCLSNTGHYLGSGQTLEVMQSEYLYPDHANRQSPTEWTDNGKPNLLEVAAKRKEVILNNYYPKHISDEIDQAIREQYPIHLSPKTTGRRRPS